jgi:hypothetical protein
MNEIKTEKQIEKDIFRIIKASPINTMIGGTLYRKGMRPRNAKTEDAVVAFLSGLDGQFQTGVVLLNIYVPMTQNASSDKITDISRVETLEAAVKDFFDECSEVNYLFELLETPYSEDLDEIEQTRINVRIHYTRTTF